MDSTQQQSCIDYFYERTIQDSNIVNIDFLMDLLSEEQKVELRDTPYRDINFQKLAQSVQSTSEWATKPSKGGKQAIVKYDMKSGNVLSVGTANSKGN